MTDPIQAPLEQALQNMSAAWKASGVPDLYEGCLEPHGGPVSRERARNVRSLLYPKPVLPTGRIEARHIDVRPYGVDSDLSVRIIWPHGVQAGEAVRNTLVYFHGGGFVLGDLDSHEAHAIRLANGARCVVVNVDYRLAPEHRFPAAHDDCLAASCWAADHLAEWGGDPACLGIGGDSAGGNLAAAVALACRDRGVRLAVQLLIYPVTDLTKFNGLPEKAYLGADEVAQRGLDPRASPQLAASHAGLAPAILGVGHHDFLYRDNVAYAHCLRSAGVPLTYREFPTLNHGFFSFTAISADSLVASMQLCQDLKAHFDAAARSASAPA